MKKQTKLFFLTFILLLALTIPAFADNTFHNISGEVYFSPKGGCTEAIVKEISHAKSEIYIQAYSFTSAPIAKALVNAHKRGIKVEAILDKSNVTGNYSSATFLSNNGIPVFIDSQHAIAHNKIIIIDKETVITGSFLCGAPHKKLNAESIVMRSPLSAGPVNRSC